MIEYNEFFDDNSVLPFFIKPQNDASRGQVEFCYNLIANLLEKGISPCKQEFPEKKIKQQIPDHYLKEVCNITSYYAIFTIEISSPKPNHKKTPYTNRRYRYRILKKFYRLYKKYTTPKFTNSIFTNDVFSISYSYQSILEIKETQGDSPTQTSRYTAVRQEISIFANFLNTIRENLTNNDISQKL